MGSRERILRSKEEIRNRILTAAIHIAQKDGWSALSMRKIAEEIEYTAPIIYEYFENKEGILLELSRRGYQILAREIKKAGKKQTSPAIVIENMWVAYWDFAFRYKEFYQLMYGVEMVCCETNEVIPDMDIISALFNQTIRVLYQEKMISDDDIRIKYYSYWSAIHGLISINLVKPKSTSELMNQKILRETIKSITASIVR